MKFEIVPDEIIEAKDLAGIVTAMREGSRSPADTLEDYVKELASRAEIQTGKPHRADSATHLAEDLLASGLVKSI
jgi:hypothetical protein